MCGIAGILSLEPGRPVRQAPLGAMAAALRHRGPDSEGFHLDRELGLAYRRLSIIDLSDAANQPMSNEDGSLWMVFNGEIYNEPELRRQLLARGHRFRSDSDAEVVLHLYEEHGPGCVEVLNGMFAFAIWDARKRQLFAARDHFGVKPFYYAVAGETLDLRVGDKGAVCHRSDRARMRSRGVVGVPDVPVLPRRHDVVQGGPQAGAGLLALGRARARRRDPALLGPRLPRRRARPAGGRVRPTAARAAR